MLERQLSLRFSLELVDDKHMGALYVSLAFLYGALLASFGKQMLVMKISNLELQLGAGSEEVLI